jgi:hypothetical protein
MSQLNTFSEETPVTRISKTRTGMLGPEGRRMSHKLGGQPVSRMHSPLPRLVADLMTVPVGPVSDRDRCAEPRCKRA